MRRSAKKRRALRVARNGARVAHCAKCGAEIADVPLVVRTAIAVRCQRCFGAAPRTPGAGISDWLERLRTGGAPETPAVREAEELVEAS